MNKQKKKIFLVLTLSILIIPDVTLATTYISCGQDKQIPLVLAELISKFFTLVKIAVPIMFVISGMISFMKVIYSSHVDDELKKAKNKLLHNIIAALVVFFAISLINFAVGLVAGKDNEFMNCLNCFINPDNCEKIEKTDDMPPTGIIEG